MIQEDNPLNFSKTYKKRKTDMTGASIFLQMIIKNLLASFPNKKDLRQ